MFNLTRILIVVLAMFVIITGLTESTFAGIEGWQVVVDGDDWEWENEYNHPESNVLPFGWAFLLSDGFLLITHAESHSGVAEGESNFHYAECQAGAWGSFYFYWDGQGDPVSAKVVITISTCEGEGEVEGRLSYSSYPSINTYSTAETSTFYSDPGISFENYSYGECDLFHEPFFELWNWWSPEKTSQGQYLFEYNPDPPYYWYGADGHLIEYYGYNGIQIKDTGELKETFYLEPSDASGKYVGEYYLISVAIAEAYTDASTDDAVSNPVTEGYVDISVSIEEDDRE